MSDIYPFFLHKLATDFYPMEIIHRVKCVENGFTLVFSKLFWCICNIDDDAGNPSVHLPLTGQFMTPECLEGAAVAIELPHGAAHFLW